MTRKTATGALSTVEKYLWKVHSHLEVRGQHIPWSLYAIRYVEQQWENILHIPGRLCAKAPLLRDMIRYKVYLNSCMYISVEDVFEDVNCN
jgi:hypothetical protein